MRTPTALAVVLLGLLLYACGDSTTTTSTPSSVTPAGIQPTATTLSSETTSPTLSSETAPTLSSETTSPSATAPAATNSDDEIPQTGGTDGITLEEDQLIPPIAPDTPTLDVSSEGLVIRWRGTGPSDLLRYLVYHRRTPAEDWTQVAEVSPVGDNLGDYSHVIAAESDQTGEFAIVAVDIDGNLSSFSTAVAVGG